MGIVLSTLACTEGPRAPSDPLRELVEVTSSELRKDLGGMNSDADYCAGTIPCDLGEGDCDSDQQCDSPGVLICGSDIGPRFAMPPTWDVCVPPICVDGEMNGPETDIDCGGPCGSCTPTMCPASGAAGSCSVSCRCDAGEGDCDAANQCVAGLVCAADVGARFSMPSDYDVCLAAHCINRVLDGDETTADCGGVCGPCVCGGTNGDLNFCTPSCPCDIGEGDCDRNADCTPGRVCRGNVSDVYGHAVAVDVCVVARCHDGVANGDERDIDCGGADCVACSSSPGAIQVTTTYLAYVNYIPCTGTCDFQFMPGEFIEIITETPDPLESPLTNLAPEVCWFLGPGPNNTSNMTCIINVDDYPTVSLAWETDPQLLTLIVPDGGNASTGGTFGYINCMGTCSQEYARGTEVYIYSESPGSTFTPVISGPGCTFDSSPFGDEVWCQFQIFEPTTVSIEWEL